MEERASAPFWKMLYSYPLEVDQNISAYFAETENTQRVSHRLNISEHAFALVILVFFLLK